MTVTDPKTTRALARLARDAAGAPYWAYAIRDPLTGDRRDWTTGDPIHVGQTNDPARRARAHIAAASASAEGEQPEGDEAAARAALRERLAAILAAGRAPVFELLEPAPTRLAALAAEARWARRLRAEGFAVVAPPDDAPVLGATGVPLARAWSLTLAEAGASGVGLALACDACGTELALPLDALAERSGPAARLAALREALACPGCGRGNALALVAPERDVSPG